MLRSKQIVHAPSPQDLLKRIAGDLVLEVLWLNDLALDTVHVVELAQVGRPIENLKRQSGDLLHPLHCFLDELCLLPGDLVPRLQKVLGIGIAVVPAKRTANKKNIRRKTASKATDKTAESHNSVVIMPTSTISYKKIIKVSINL